MFDQCCAGYLSCDGDRSCLLQISVICVLLALVGTSVIVKHPDWFGGVPVASQSLAER
jgi:hypothetical protein